MFISSFVFLFLAFFFLKQVMAAGVVVLRSKQKDHFETIIVVQDSNTNFGFPKGGKNKGEYLTETALRELREETGLTPDDIIIIPHAPIEEIKNRRDKIGSNKSVISAHIDETGTRARRPPPLRSESCTSVQNGNNVATAGSDNGLYRNKRDNEAIVSVRYLVGLLRCDSRFMSSATKFTFDAHEIDRVEWMPASDAMRVLIPRRQAVLSQAIAAAIEFQARDSSTASSTPQSPSRATTDITEEETKSPTITAQNKLLLLSQRQPLQQIPKFVTEKRITLKDKFDNNTTTTMVAATTITATPPTVCAYGAEAPYALSLRSGIALQK